MMRYRILSRNAVPWRIGIAAAIAMLVAATEAREPNYDESKVAQYALEDPLVFADGRKLKDASEWTERRKEILDLFAMEMYGQPAPKPEAVVCELVEEGPTLSGLAIRRQYRMWFRKDRSGPFVDWLMVLPNRIEGKSPKTNGVHLVCENKCAVPVVLMLNFRGNHAVLNDPEVPLPADAWFRSSSYAANAPKESERGFARDSRSRTTVPAEFVVARGYALLTACYAQVSPDVEVKRGDDESLAYTRVFDLWPKRDERRDDNTTALGAWAWALSRGLDLAERIPEVDAQRSVVTGSSRLGKAALLAAARDERFAVCVANQTGGGGCPLAKRDFGENVSTEMKSFPHWYCRAYAKYIDNEQAMKFDQHLLLAAIAPRALLVEGFNAPWFDTKGEWLACRAASPVWEFLGQKGLPNGEWPESYDTSCIGESLGYVRRGGAHGISGHDWKWALDFADRALMAGGVAIPLREFNVVDYGAKGDGVATNTVAFRAAVEACRPAARFTTAPWWTARLAATRSAILKEKDACYDLVLVGDSITHRWENNANGAEVYPKLKAKFKLLNLGNGGDKTQNVIWRFENNGELDDYTAKVFAVMIGVNNGDAEPEGTIAGVKKIVGMIREKHPESKILLQAILPHGKEPLNAVSAKVINPALEAYAEASGLAWLDMSEKFLGENGELKPGLMMPDNLHPIKEGYEIWLGGLAPAVEKLME